LELLGFGVHRFSVWTKLAWFTEVIGEDIGQTNAYLGFLGDFTNTEIKRRNDERGSGMVFECHRWLTVYTRKVKV
jgi:hypothetical protein